MRSFWRHCGLVSGKKRNRNLHDVTESNESGREFFPSGAIFFFVLLLVFYALLWFMDRILQLDFRLSGVAARTSR